MSLCTLTRLLYLSLCFIFCRWLCFCHIFAAGRLVRPRKNDKLIRESNHVSGHRHRHRTTFIRHNIRLFEIIRVFLYIHGRDYSSEWSHVLFNTVLQVNDKKMSPSYTPRNKHYTSMFYFCNNKTLAKNRCY